MLLFLKIQNRIHLLRNRQSKTVIRSITILNLPIAKYENYFPDFL